MKRKLSVTMMEYTFKSGAAPHSTEQSITKLKSDWDNKKNMVNV